MLICSRTPLLAKPKAGNELENDYIVRCSLAAVDKTLARTNSGSSPLLSELVRAFLIIEFFYRTNSHPRQTSRSIFFSRHYY